jgi:choline dehydrogenase-like flavoprotein
MASAVPGSKEVFDAIVVGSGATGGWAAKELTEAGLRVALVEAGRNLVPEKDFTEHVLPYQVSVYTVWLSHLLKDGKGTS